MKCRTKLIIGLVVSLFFISSIAVSQNIIKGKVIDKITKEPLELAVINNENALKNTLTDKQGNFILKKSSKDSLEILISFIGYTSQQIKIKPGNTPITIELEK